MSLSLEWSGCPWNLSWGKDGRNVGYPRFAGSSEPIGLTSVLFVPHGQNQMMASPSQGEKSVYLSILFPFVRPGLAFIVHSMLSYSAYIKCNVCPKQPSPCFYPSTKQTRLPWSCPLESLFENCANGKATTVEKGRILNKWYQGSRFIACGKN